MESSDIDDPDRCILMFGRIIELRLQVLPEDNLVAVRSRNPKLPKPPRLVLKLVPKRNTCRIVFGIQPCGVGDMEIREP